MITEPGRVGIAGDWHGNTFWGQQMLDVCAAQGVRTVLHLGNFGLWPSYQGTGYLKRLEEHLVKNGQTLYWVDGNHEDHAPSTLGRSSPTGCATWSCDEPDGGQVARRRSGSKSRGLRSRVSR